MLSSNESNSDVKLSACSEMNRTVCASELASSISVEQLASMVEKSKQSFYGVHLLPELGF